MKWSTAFKGAWSGVKFVYNHPQILEIAAAVPGAPGQIAAGIATVVQAVGAAKASSAAGGQPPLPPPPPPFGEPTPESSAPPLPPAPPPEPAAPAIVPEVDLVAKWRGTLDRMAMEILGKRMDEDELFNNAKLLERGDVEGVTRNLEGKKPR